MGITAITGHERVVSTLRISVHILLIHTHKEGESEPGDQAAAKCGYWNGKDDSADQEPVRTDVLASATRKLG